MTGGEQGQEIVRTHIHCHSCGKGFVAELEGTINGKHEICCPHCDHLHYRILKDGIVTESRWGHDTNSCATPVTKARSVWRSSVINAKTSSVAQHIRERWLERSDIQ